MEKEPREAREPSFVSIHSELEHKKNLVFQFNYFLLAQRKCEVTDFK